MNDLASSHENIEKINDKFLSESFNILGSTIDLYQAEEIIGEGKDGTFDIFGHSLSDNFCPNFEQLSPHQISSDASFSDNSQITTSSKIEDGWNDGKPKLDFPMFNKVWPDQLDILAGPLLEGDEDSTYNDSDTFHKYSINGKGVDLISDSEQALHLNNSMRTEIGKMKKVLNFDSIACRRNIELKFGSIVHISKGEDTGEEIDVVTIDDDSSADDVNSDNQNCLQDLHTERCNEFSSDVAAKGFNTDSCKSNMKYGLLGMQATVVEDVPKVALEAPDLDSLLEKFEATEGVNKTEKKTTECHENRLTNTEGTLGLSPKDSCATSIIKKIKSSTVPSRSAIMISPETVLKSNSRNRLKKRDSAQCFGSVSSKKYVVPISTTSKEPTVTNLCTNYNGINSGDDHDYCFPSSSSLLKGVHCYNKIPEYLTQLKPRKNSNHNTITEKALSSKDDKAVNTPLENSHVVENAFPKSSKDTLLKSNDITLHSFQNKRRDISSLSPNSSNLPEDEILCNINACINENSTNVKCQIAEDPELKKPHPTELLKLSNSPKSETVGVVGSADFLDKCNQHLANESSNGINCSPSCSPPSKWHHERRSWSHSPPFGRQGTKFSKARTHHRQNFRSSEYKEKLKQVEERRVLYVGNIPEGITRADLRERFGKFGPIHEVSIHIRDFDDNYAFVTFCNRNDAYMAVEHGNDDPNLPRFELSFGGRRQFCKVKYADLDSYNSSERRGFQKNGDLDFDSLLKDAKAQFKSRYLCSKS